MISAGVYSHDRHARRRRGEQRDAAGVPELQRAAHVLGVEDVLDGDAVGPVLGEQRDEPGVNEEQAVGKSADGRRGERAAGDETVTAAVGVDAAVARALGSGIDPEK